MLYAYYILALESKAHVESIGEADLAQGPSVVFSCHRHRRPHLHFR